jgi:death-on-curing protein
VAEPHWIRNDVVVAIHRRQLAEHGGRDGIRDQGLLESALARPKNLLAYSEADPPDLADLAAAYAFGLVRNHPFIDGNKRTAYVACRTFLKLNGQDLLATQEEKFVAFLRLAEGLLSEPELADWIRQHLNDPGDNAQPDRRRR